MLIEFYFLIKWNNFDREEIGEDLSSNSKIAHKTTTELPNSLHKY